MIDNIRLEIPIKLENDYHQFLLSECKNEEAVKIENIRHMMKLQILEYREKMIREESQEWSLEK